MSDPLALLLKAVSDAASLLQADDRPEAKEWLAREEVRAACGLDRVEVPASNYSEHFLQAAHEYSRFHRTAILESNECGCFQCLRTFHPSEITRWTRSNADHGDFTCAICPHCHCDSVLPSSSVALSDDLLKAMRARWFAPRRE